MRKSISFGITLIVIPLIFLAFNLVWALKIPDIQVDVSAQKKYTLSSHTQALLASLESPIDLYFFNSSKHPKKNTALKSYGKHVETLLKAYAKAAKGKINLHLIDPAPFSEEQYKAGLFGLDGTQGFFGLIGTRANQRAHRIESFIPDQEPFLEYEISHLIHKVDNPEQPIIGLISGLPMDGEWDESSQTRTPPWRLLQEVRRQFNLVSIGKDTEQIPKHVKTLMLVHPAMLSEKTLHMVDQFVIGGGKLMVFIDPLSELSAQTATTQNTANLNGLLTAWGIQMQGDKVLADSIYASPVMLTEGQPAVRHPAALTLPHGALARNDVSAWKLHNVSVLSSGAITPLKKSRMTFTPLLQSSPQAALLAAARFSRPDSFASLISETASHNQRHVIAARIQGPAYSAFAKGIDDQEAGLRKAADIHVVVVADTDMLRDQVWTHPQNNNEQIVPRSGNATFVLNVLDHLSGPDALLGIAPRTNNHRTRSVLKTMRNNAEQSYREKAAELERRLELTEKEWQLLNPPSIAFGTQEVPSNTFLQALNKERLSLPMELHALKTQAYVKVHTLERNIKLLNIVPIPLILSLIAMGISLSRQRSQYSLSFQGNGKFNAA